MSAETIKKKYKPRTRRPTELQKKIIDIKQTHPSLNKNEIASIAGCDHAHVIRTLQNYGLIKDDVDDFVNNRAAVFAGMQHRLLKSITDADIQKTPVGSRILATAQLYDKERLEVGKTTSNIAQVIFQMPAPKPVPDHLKMIIEEKNSEDNNDGGVSV